MEEKVLLFIKSIRESFGASIAVYTMGNCYQFYEILKTVFPDAEAFENGHVLTKIDGEFYDIRGKLINEGNKEHLYPVLPERIWSLSQNKWTDERRKEYAEEERRNAFIKTGYISPKLEDDFKKI